MTARTVDPPSSTLPEWVPDAALAYLAHACEGRPLRAVAADPAAPRRPCSGRFAASRRVATTRSWTTSSNGSRRPRPSARPIQTRRTHPTCQPCPIRATLIDDETLEREGRRVLRRLCETDAFLAVGQGMPQAVVLRETGDTPTRTATLPRPVAQAFVLKDWVTCFKAGRITRYRITEQGRSALKRLLCDSLSAQGEGPRDGRIAEPVPDAAHGDGRARRSRPARRGGAARQSRRITARSARAQEGP